MGTEDEELGGKVDTHRIANLRGLIMKTPVGKRMKQMKNMTKAPTFRPTNRRVRSHRLTMVENPNHGGAETLESLNSDQRPKSVTSESVSDAGVTMESDKTVSKWSIVFR